MEVSRRIASPSRRMEALINHNAELQADSAKLAKDNTDLTVERDMLKQKNKFMQVIVALLLASGIGMGVGMGTSMAHFSPGAALTLATTIFFAVITVSLAIMNYMNR